MKEINHHLFTYINETQWLGIIYSYLRHQIDPQPSIPLSYLEDLHPTDIDAITPDMFKVHKYTKEDVEHMLEALNLIIIKKQNEEYGETDN